MLIIVTVEIDIKLFTIRSKPIAAHKKCTAAVLVFSTCCIVEGAEGFVSEEDQEMLNRIEKQMKRRFVIGSQVSEHAIVQDFTRQVFVTPPSSSCDVVYSNV